MQELNQRSWSNKTKFQFKDDKLDYTIKYSSGSHSFSINYGSIPLDDKRELEEKNSWFRNVGILWLLIGGFQTFLRFSDSGDIKISMWIILGAICFIAFLFAKTKYTILGTESGNILIIRNKQHDNILTEITQRRKEQLLAWYGEINYTNDPNDEMNKFLWLKNQNLISEEQLEDVKEKLIAYHQNEAPETLTIESKEKTVN